MSNHAGRSKRLFAGFLAAVLALTVAPILGSASPAGADNHLEAADPTGEGNFCEAVPQQDPFTDVQDSDPSYDEIVCLVATEVTTGVTATTYEPLSFVTRRQMALFLTRVAAEADRLEIDDNINELPEPADNEFADVEGEEQFIQYAISQIAQAEIAEGFEDGNYRPAAPVTRRQMAAFIDRLYEYLTGEALPDAAADNFEDDDEDSAEAQASTNAVAEAGIFIGDEDGTFRPAQEITRRQMANVLTRTFEVLFENGEIETIETPAQVVGSVRQLHVSGTEEGVEVEVEGPDGYTASGTTDENGTLVLREVPAGEGYRVRLDGGSVADRTVDVMSADDHPEQAFYEAQELPTDGGYIETRDGTLLAYQVVLPDPEEFGDGPYPVVIDYSGYKPSIDFYDGVEEVFPALGYAAVGVNMRGTACSGGAFDYFEELQATDGYDMVEALAAQPWSDGVALVGKSYPGISQLFVASTQPPSLEAIVPGHPLSEFYRDVAYPGGILNVGFATVWAADMDAEAAFPSAREDVNEAAESDPVCRENQEFRGQNLSVVEGMLTHPTDGPYWSERAPERLAESITVPTLVVDSWQDEQVGSGSALLLDRFPEETEARLLGTNGDHGEYYRGEVWEEIVEFLDVYLGDRSTEDIAEYEAQDPVTIFLETGMPGSEDAGDPRVRLTLEEFLTGDGGERWYLRDGGLLSETQPLAGEDDSTSYEYVPQGPGGQLMPDQNTWTEAPAEGEAAVFVTAPLDQDVVMAGTGSLDLVLSSELADTDVEVTLSEVRPDGSEMLVQSGWLRASHRALDEEASTVLLPRHLHTAESLEQLEPGEPTPMRVRLFPFAHAFRAGSSIKISIDAPGGNRYQWAFNVNPETHTDTVWHSPTQVSSIALPVVDVDVELGDRPECGTVSSQPCRETAPVN